MKINRVVIDTNVLVASFLSPGKPRQLLELFFRRKFILCLSEPIIEEYVRVLVRLKISDSRIEQFLSEIQQAENVLFIRNPKIVQVVKSDPDDDKFFACAVTLNADYIISGDKAVLAIKAHKGVKVMSVSEYLDNQ